MPPTSFSRSDLTTSADFLQELLNLGNLVPVPWCSILLHVAMNPGKTQVEISSATKVGTSVVSRAIDYFRELGMVVQEPSSEDRRLKHVNLTAKGERFIQGLLGTLKRRAPQ